jgi:hypothetical protein
MNHRWKYVAAAFFILLMLGTAGCVFSPTGSKENLPGLLMKTLLSSPPVN